MNSSGLVVLIVGIDLGIFLFLWTVIALWMRLFRVYSLRDLLGPLVLGSVCWEASLFIRYYHLSSGGLDGLVIRTVVCFMACIQVIRFAVPPRGAAQPATARESGHAVREILPTSAGEWVLMCSLFAAWALFEHTVGHRLFGLDLTNWGVSFAAGVFVVLFISRMLWRLLRWITGRWSPR